MKSPYNLLQEIYINEKQGIWKILVCCQFLNITTRRQVDRVRHEFFRRWPTPQKAMHADSAEMASLIKSLGLFNRRSVSIIRMSQEFLLKDWKEPKELYGLGQYAQDSYDIFVRGVRPPNPSDKFLQKYLDWVKL